MSNKALRFSKPEKKIRKPSRNPNQLTMFDDHRPPTSRRVKHIEPLNDNQRTYDNSIYVNSLTFGLGPAGTGKSWLAVMRAAEALDNKRISKIVITRPALEAGEKLGFLPGELDEKYDPYLRPLKDAFEEYFGITMTEMLLKSGRIEARPLAYIRGSTLKDCWVIADEMQNASVLQMKTLLTRIGDNCKFIINGDPEQCDLPNPKNSGLEDAACRLREVNDIGFVRFTDDDIVRSGLCQDIVRAYRR